MLTLSSEPHGVPAVSYLCEKRLVDFHSFIRALGQDLASAVPAVADGRVGVRHASQEYSPFVVELLLGLSDALMYRHHWVVEICGEITGRDCQRRLSLQQHIDRSVSINDSVPVL